MALAVHWYDFICFAIIFFAFIGSLYVIYKRDCIRKDDDDKYQSLLLDRPSGSASPRSYGYIGSSDLWMTCWKGLNPAWMLITRMLSASVMAGILAWDVRRYSSSIFVYYTEWTFTLVIVYFMMGIVMSAYGCWKYSKQPNLSDDGRNDFLKSDLEENISVVLNSRANKIKNLVKFQVDYEQIETEQRAGCWGYLIQIIYQTSAGAVLLTDIIFWFLLVPFLSVEHFSLNLLMGCMHSLNLIFLLIDTALNRLTFPWFRIAYFVMWSCLYVIFQWILHACGFSWWPYPFLELSTPWAPLWYICLALVHLPCYGVYVVIVKAKNAIFTKLFPHTFIKIVVTPS